MAAAQPSIAGPSIRQEIHHKAAKNTKKERDSHNAFAFLRAIRGFVVKPSFSVRRIARGLGDRLLYRHV
jgi:hypothetical protein